MIRVLCMIYLYTEIKNAAQLAFIYNAYILIYLPRLCNVNRFKLHLISRCLFGSSFLCSHFVFIPHYIGCDVYLTLPYQPTHNVKNITLLELTTGKLHLSIIHHSLRNALHTIINATLLHRFDISK